MKIEEIIPEIRKGRRFKSISPKGVESCWVDKDFTNWHLSIEMFLEDGWELEPIKKEISREDLAAAWDKHMQDLQMLSANARDRFDAVCKELGI